MVDTLENNEGDSVGNYKNFISYSGIIRIIPFFCNCLFLSLINEIGTLIWQTCY